MQIQEIFSIFMENRLFFLRGAATTILIAIVSTVMGFVIGLCIGTFRAMPEPEGKSKIVYRILRALSTAYIEIFRGTPMMVQAMVIFYGIPLLFGIRLARLPAALFIVSINTGAYMAEIVRGGIESVDTGQYEAAKALGMNHLQLMRFVILPVAIRTILPSIGNEFIINIKDTSVLNVIGVSELYFQSATVAGNNYKFFETYFITSVIYLIMTMSITIILRRIERRMDGVKNYQMNQQQV